MKIILTEKEIMKIINTLNMESIENRLNYNCKYWDIKKISNENEFFELTKPEKSEE